MTDSTNGVPPRLNRQTVLSGRLTNDRVVVPAPELLSLPEKAVQFGTGAFLRGFVDYFLDEANRRGDFGGRVVAIGSTASGRDVSLNDQDGLYTLVVEGAGNDGPRQESRVLASVSRAISAQRDWTEVLAIARKPELELVFSNTTEVGIAIDDGDRLDAVPPPSFPGKLTRFLVERARTFDYADNAGVIVIPCELIEGNGDRLRELVMALAQRWQLEPAFAAWVDRAARFCNTLVDRIVPGRPSDEKRAALEAALGYRDELMIAAEPYRLFAIETDHVTRGRLTFARADDGIVLTDDVSPFRERKVRILNGGHTLLASLGLAVGCRTVLEAMQHDYLGKYLRRVLHEEIVPTLAAPNGDAFAHDVLVRFANPYLRHALADITLQHTAKLRVRVVPSIVRFAERTGAVPTSLALGFAAYLFLQRAAVSPDQAVRPPLGADTAGERVRDFWRGAAADDDQGLADVVRRVCSDANLWQTDLTNVSGFAEQVAADLSMMMRRGVEAALEAHIDALQGASGSYAPSLSNVR